jgi:hypothetical protein
VIPHPTGGHDYGLLTMFFLIGGMIGLIVGQRLPRDPPT